MHPKTRASHGRKDIRNLHLVNEKHRADMAWLFAKANSKFLLLSELRPALFIAQKCDGDTFLRAL